MPIPISVKISAVELRAKTFLEEVRRALSDRGLEARYLELELRETFLMQDSPSTSAVLHTLKHLGSRADRHGQESAHAGRRGRCGNHGATCIPSRWRLSVWARLLFGCSTDGPRMYQCIKASHHCEWHSRSSMLSRESTSPRSCSAAIDASINPKHNHLLASLPHDQWQRLLPPHEQVDLPLGRLLDEAGSTPSHVYFPTSGHRVLLY